jgi:hypothetical protein
MGGSLSISGKVSVGGNSEQRDRDGMRQMERDRM